jgi:hypothetical protein
MNYPRIFRYVSEINGGIPPLSCIGRLILVQISVSLITHRLASRSYILCAERWVKLCEEYSCRGHDLRKRVNKRRLTKAKPRIAVVAERRG